MKVDTRRDVPAWITLGGNSIAHCTLDRRRTVCGRELNADERDARSVVVAGGTPYDDHLPPCLRCSSKLSTRGWVKFESHTLAHFIQDARTGETLCGKDTYRHTPDLQACIALYARVIREHGSVPDPTCPACLRRSA